MDSVLWGATVPPGRDGVLGSFRAQGLTPHEAP